jgi:hypothetical protein
VIRAFTSTPISNHVQEFIVLNYFEIETEAAYRRSEWERKAAAATNAAQVHAKTDPRQPPHLPHRILARLRALSNLQLPISCWTTPAKKRAEILESGSASAG